MAISNGPNLGIMINGLQGEAHYSQFMAFLRGMDFFGMPRVTGYLTNTPPGSPTNGESHIIGAAPTGTWAGQGGKIARYNGTGSAWEFFTPQEGWMIQRGSAGVREIYRYTSAAWEIFYGEGTWTPALKFGGLSVGMTTSVAQGRYTKIGRLWELTARIVLSAKGTSAGSAAIYGAPATPAEGMAYTIGYYGNFSAGLVPTAYQNSADANIYIGKAGGTSLVAASDTDFTNGSSLIISGTMQQS